MLPGKLHYNGVISASDDRYRCSTCDEAGTQVKVISASDDRYRCSAYDEVGTQVVQRSRIPKLRAAKGSEDLTKNNSR